MSDWIDTRIFIIWFISLILFKRMFSISTVKFSYFDTLDFLFINLSSLIMINFVCFHVLYFGRLFFNYGSREPCELLMVQRLQSFLQITDACM